MIEKGRVEMVDSYATADARIRAEAMPIDVHAAAAFNNGIDRLVAAPGDSVELLGMGEALHGGEEILHFRNRLFERLVTQHGYCAIAIESSHPRSRVVNEFVTGRATLPYDAIRESGFSHGFGRLAANRELVEWMRRYNATAGNRTPLHFYGFDAPTDAGPTDSPRQLLYFALDYLASIDSRAAASHRDRIEPLLGDDAPGENPAAAMNPSLAIGLSPRATALRVATENLISELKERRPELVTARGMAHFTQALHDASEARQLLTYHAHLATPSGDRQGRLLGIRAAIMADNLTHIASRELPRGKVLLFAHNTHLQRSKVEWQFGDEQVHWWPTGAHLHTLFGPRYAAIASAVGASPDNGIAEAEAHTLEALLAPPGTPPTLTPTHRGRHLPPGALHTLPPRSGSTHNRSYSPLTPRHIQDFDWILTFAYLTPTRPT